MNRINEKRCQKDFEFTRCCTHTMGGGSDWLIDSLDLRRYKKNKYIYNSLTQQWMIVNITTINVTKMDDYHVLSQQHPYNINNIRQHPYIQSWIIRRKTTKVSNTIIAYTKDFLTYLILSTFCVQLGCGEYSCLGICFHGDTFMTNVTIFLYYRYEGKIGK